MNDEDDLYLMVLESMGASEEAISAARKARTEQNLVTVPKSTDRSLFSPRRPVLIEAPRRYSRSR